MVERLHIRDETTDDIKDIWQLNNCSFTSSEQADLVNRLRDSDCEFISLVATLNDVIVGHIVFTPVRLDSAADLKIMGLAPMCVAPDQQKQGIGSQLVNAGLDRCRATGSDAVVVLGHADYYPRFGFRSASLFNIKSAYDVADDVFMVLELRHDCLKAHSGLISYHPAFND